MVVEMMVVMSQASDKIFVVEFPVFVLHQQFLNLQYHY
jgi:hypothetical protein